MHARLSVIAGIVAMSLCSAGLAQAPAAVAQGSYECWGNGSPRLLLNFKVTGKDRYTDAEGKEKGSFTYNAANGSITFKGGHLDGVMPKGFTSVYHEKNKRPTVSFRSGRGAEASFCELKSK